MSIDLRLGDCLPILRSMPDKSVDLVLTDPPYGKGDKRQRFGRKESISFEAKDFLWDERPSREYFDEMRRVSKNQIFWGGNYFIDYLSPTNCMLVWDKKNGNNPYADVEIAWTSFRSVSKKFEMFWLGAHIHRIEKIYHPTQKPTALMKWCLENYSKQGDVILDPFMGSGSTGAACVQLERGFIGIEKNYEYYEIVPQRIQEAQQQMVMAL